MPDITSNLAIYAKFDGNALDSSGNARNGTATGSPSYVAGSAGQAVNLVAASTQYVEFGTAPAMNGVANFSLALRYKPTSLVDYMALATKHIDGTNSIRIMTGGAGLVNNSALVCVVANGANTFGLSAGSQITVGQWSSILMVYDGSLAAANRIKLYVNGAAVALVPQNGDAPTTTANLTAAAWRAGGGVVGTVHTNGAEDEFRVYQRALTSDDAVALHAYADGLQRLNPGSIGMGIRIGI